MALLLLPASASAASSSGSWHISAEGGTDFPVALGLRGTVEGPYRLRGTLSVGHLPGVYVDTINAFCVGMGFYTQADADLIRQVVKSSLVLRTHLGWRPFSGHGFYFDIGHDVIGLGGEASDEQMLVLATGSTPPHGAAYADQYKYTLESRLHLLAIELGWEWTLLDNDRLVLRGAAGFAKTVAAKTTGTPEFVPKAEEGVSTFLRDGSDYLDNLYTSYVMTPVLSVYAGYRFF